MVVGVLSIQYSFGICLLVREALLRWHCFSFWGKKVKEGEERLSLIYLLGLFKRKEIKYFLKLMRCQIKILKILSQESASLD